MAPSPPARRGPPSLHHLALGAQDVAQVAAFYRDVVGLPERARHFHEDGSLRSIWLGLNGESVLMIEGTTAPSRPEDLGVEAGLFLLAFRIEASQRTSWETRLTEAGAAIERRTDATSYARDPEGNRFAVSFYRLESS